MGAGAMNGDFEVAATGTHRKLDVAIEDANTWRERWREENQRAERYKAALEEIAKCEFYGARVIARKALEQSDGG